MVSREALLGHKVLIEVARNDATSYISWIHLSAESRPALLLRNRSLVQIARFEELVDRGKPVLLRGLLLALAILLLNSSLDHLHIIVRRLIALLPEGRRWIPSCRALRCNTVSHLVNVRSELLSRSDLE